MASLRPANRRGDLGARALSLAVAGGADREVAMAAALNAVLATTAADAAVVHLVEGGVVTYRATLERGGTVRSTTDPKAPFVGGTTDEILRTGRAIVVDDLLARTSPHPVVLARGIRSSAHVPVVVGGATAGTLNAEWREPGAATTERVGALEDVAASLAVAVAHLAARDDAESRARVMGVVANATAAIAAAPGLDAALRALLGGVRALTGATAGAVRVPVTPGTSGPSRVYRWFGGDRYEWQEVETLRGSVTAEVLADGRGRYVSDNAAAAAAGDVGAQIGLRSFGVRSSLIVPLRAAGALEGTVHANSDQPHAFREEQLAILQVLADHAGAAVERVRLLAETRAEVKRRAVAEEALRASEDRFRRQYKGNPVPVYTWRRDGDDYVLADYNDAAQEITGGAIHSILGVRCGVFYADAPEVLGDFRRCVADGASVRREMWYRLRSSGELRYLAVTYVPLPPDLIAVYTEDATARKIAEEQSAAQERSEKLQLLGQMAGGVAHDLSQSLAMVAGFADLAKHALAASAPDVTGVRAMLDTVTRAAMDGGAAVQRLLVFTRDRDDGPPERVDVSALLREVAELTAPRWQGAAQAEGRPIALAVDAESAATVMGHPAILRQALTNLVVNAVDALPEGGSVRLTSELRGDTVAIAVADTGVGMTEEVRRRALEPFYSTKGDRGTGLGLAQVVAIAEKHGGRVELRSSPGQGTTVTLELLAAATSPPDRAAGVPAAPPTTGAPLRVLVVDDEPTLADMAATMLERGGHSTATACSGEAALALLEAERYDLVVSDLSLGAGMNGWEVAARIRERWPNTRVALATGWGASIDRAQARARGVETVLAKPYRVADLQALAAR